MRYSNNLRVFRVCLVYVMMFHCWIAPGAHAADGDMDPVAAAILSAKAEIDQKHYARGVAILQNSIETNYGNPLLTKASEALKSTMKKWMDGAEGAANERCQALATAILIDPDDQWKFDGVMQMKGLLAEIASGKKKADIDGVIFSLQRCEKDVFLEDIRTLMEKSAADKIEKKEWLSAGEILASYLQGYRFPNDEGGKIEKLVERFIDGMAKDIPGLNKTNTFASLSLAAQMVEGAYKIKVKNDLLKIKIDQAYFSVLVASAKKYEAIGDMEYALDCLKRALLVPGSNDDKSVEDQIGKLSDASAKIANAATLPRSIKKDLKIQNPGFPLRADEPSVVEMARITIGPGTCLVGGMIEFINAEMDCQGTVRQPVILRNMKFFNNGGNRKVISGKYVVYVDSHGTHTGGWGSGGEPTTLSNSVIIRHNEMYVNWFSEFFLTNCTIISCFVHARDLNRAYFTNMEYVDSTVNYRVVLSSDGANYFNCKHSNEREGSNWDVTLPTDGWTAKPAFADQKSYSIAKGDWLSRIRVTASKGAKLDVNWAEKRNTKAGAGWDYPRYDAIFP